MSCRLATRALTSSAVNLVGGGSAEEGFEPGAPFLVGFGDPLADGRGGLWFGAHDGAEAAEFLVELADPLPDLPLLCLVIGVGLRGVGKLGAGIGRGARR